MGALKVPQNRLFPQTDKMKSGIISSIVTDSSTKGVSFVAVTFGVGIDSLHAERVN